MHSRNIDPHWIVPTVDIRYSTCNGNKPNEFNQVTVSLTSKYYNDSKYADTKITSVHYGKS